MRTIAAVIGFCVLGLIPAALMEWLFNTALFGGFVLAVFLIAPLLSFPFVALVVWCCDRETDMGVSREAMARPPWQPAFVLAILAALLGGWATRSSNPQDILWFAWLGAALGGSAGLSNYLIRAHEGY